jgi:hypothetical protein
MANREKTGRVVGTVAAIGIVISVLAIIYMAMRPHVQAKDNSYLARQRSFLHRWVG